MTLVDPQPKQWEQRALEERGLSPVASDPESQARVHRRQWEALQRGHTRSIDRLTAEIRALRRHVARMDDTLGQMAARHVFEEPISAQLNDEDEALDWIYDTFDECLVRHQFGECDALLREATRIAPSLSTTLLLGILTVTAAADRRLVNRARLLAVTKRLVEHREEMEEGLFEGLE